MANWYCDYTNGNDSTGSGTSGSPYKTLQKAISVASGGDTIYIANTSAQVLTSEISWTGFTANSSYLDIKSWNNGGSLTIQKPNEASARVAAFINGGGVATFFFSRTSIPTKVRFWNIKFYNHNIAGNPFMHYTPNDWSFIGCAFDGGDLNAQFVYCDGFTTFINCYFYASINPSGNLMMCFDNTIIKNCYFDNETNSSTRDTIQIASVGFIDTTIIKQTGAGRGINITSNYGFVRNCTFVSDGSANQTGLYTTGSSNHDVTNNLFYKFNGSSSKPYDLSVFARYFTVGYNSTYDCNAGTISGGAIADLTSFDVSGSGDPFVNSAGNDYSVTGSSSEGAGVGQNMNIGAVQEISGGGGGGGTTTVAYAFMG